MLRLLRTSLLATRRGRSASRRGMARHRRPEALEPRDMMYDVSPPAILQWFESSYDTVENRMADLFEAGYGAVWLPPPGRADISNFSVGYDVYDRFDLGQPGDKTLYGTETGLKTLADELHKSGHDLHVDFILNHNGFTNQGTPGFFEAGGYPGFFLNFFGDPDGDFNSAYSYGDVQGRLAGLIDIAHTKNYRAVRNPVPGFNNNVAAGTSPLFGRLANQPDENNRRFYPNIGHNTIFVFDPVTGEQNIPVHSFNLENPLAGDPTEENALGYIMRNAQWLVQTIGVDGLRIDAAKHVDGFVLDFIDRAVYRTNPRSLLDGSPKHVFSYSEVYDANPAVLLPHVKKTINPFDPGRIGGNRDTLDFKLYFALKENLEHAGTPFAWHTIRNAALDFSDDGLHNGSAGVLFTFNHDVFKPFDLDTVAQAYVLMHPGNAAVYFNGKEFGDNRDFPKEGRSDALSVGGGGSPLTRLVDIRNTHGRGDYAERWIDDQGLFSYERVSSSIVLLSNRGDNGFDSRTLTNVGFAPGTHLIELTGNAENSFLDPFNDIPEVVTVFNEGGVNKVNVRFPRNRNAFGDWTGQGYAIYGLPTPQSNAGLELSNVATVMAGDTTPNSNYENGTQRQSDVYVVNADSFQARLLTREVRLLGSDSLRDIFADGDNALFRIDGGVDVNGNGVVDVRTAGDISYGFEFFGNKSSPLIGPQGLGGPRGDGEFLQTVDATQLAEGYHYLTARAYRHRTDNGPPVYTDWKKTVYIDRLPPESAVASFNPFTPGVNENRDLVIRSVDKTANNVHVFLNLPASLSQQDILNMASGGNHATEIDRDLFKFGFFNVPHGNNVATVVTFEPTGNVNVQRFPGLFTSTVVGAGLGDVNFDGQYSPSDIDTFRTLLLANNTQFNSAADMNADGLINWHDFVQLQNRLNEVSASNDTQNAYQGVRAEFFRAVTDTFTIDENDLLGVLPSGVLGNDVAGLPQIVKTVTNPGAFASNLGATVTLFADGGFTYDPLPSATLQALGVGQVANDFFNYTLGDGNGNETSGRVDVNVNGLNAAPSLDDLADLTIVQDTATGPLAFTVNDADTPLANLTVTATSSNPSLVPNENILLGGSGGNRTVNVTPAAGQAGTATITLTVSDGNSQAQSSFVLSVGLNLTWQNTALRFDINGTGVANNTDLFQLLAELRNPGPRLFTLPPVPPLAPPPFLDVNGDNKFTNADLFELREFLRNQANSEGEGEGEGVVLPWQLPLAGVLGSRRVVAPSQALPSVPVAVAAVVPAAAAPPSTSAADLASGLGYVDLELEFIPLHDSIADDLAFDLAGQWR